MTEVISPLSFADHQNYRLRSHLLNGDNRNSAVALPLVREEDGWKVLMMKRADHISNGGEYAFPGGKQEKGEREIGTALRESLEEINLDPTKVSLLEQRRKYYTKLKSRKGGKGLLMIRPFVVHVDPCALATLKPDDVEAKEVVAVPLAPLIEALHDRTSEAVVSKMPKMADWAGDPKEVLADLVQCNARNVVTGETHPIELHHVTAGILLDFLARFNSEADIGQYVISQVPSPLPEVDMAGKWHRPGTNGSSHSR